MTKNTRNFILSILVVLFFFDILAWIAVFDLTKPQFLEVTFFDVNQGDSIFIETPKRNQILIDGGPNSKILEKLGSAMPFYDKSIDLVILTHPEYDHLAGLIEVLKKYKVENILWTGVLKDTAEFGEWKKLIEKEKAKIFIAKAGQKLISSGIVLEILYPFEILEGKNFKDSNNTSLVTKLIFGKNSFLFAGDIYESVEKEIIEDKISIDSDLLKVSHHGSKTSSSEKFLKDVSPKIAIISVGKNNKYGHPHQEVLEVLEKFGIKILRTDLQGDIKIISDGHTFVIANIY